MLLIANKCPCGPPKADMVMSKMFFRKVVLANSFNWKVTVFVFSAMIIIIGTISCRSTSKLSKEYPFKADKKPDYEDLKNWAAHPYLHDRSDSLSEAFGEDLNEDLCDVFFLHPTSFTDKDYKHVWNASLADHALNEKTDNSSILYQASVFNGIGRIYAPRYRQAHIHRYYDNGPSQIPAFELAYQDVKSAFLQYMLNWNHGRPIIIAAHSQGTTHAVRLVKELIDRHDISNNVKYMYLLGMPVRKKEFTEVIPCRDDTSSNCFFSWRTFRKGYSNEYTNEQENSIQVTNPVDIKNNIGWVKKGLKKEAILWNYNIAYASTHDTKVQGDMLWITRPHFKGGLLGIFMKNYHAGDFNLFYGDIRRDIKKRLINSIK